MVSNKKKKMSICEIAKNTISLLRIIDLSKFTFTISVSRKDT